MRSAAGEASRSAEVHALCRAAGGEVRMRSQPAHRRRVAREVRMRGRTVLGKVRMCRRSMRNPTGLAGKTRPFVSPGLGGLMAGRTGACGSGRAVASAGVGCERARCRARPRGRCDMGAMELARPFGRRDWRPAVVLAISQGSDSARGPLMPELLRRRAHVMFVRRREFGWSGPNGRSPVPAVVADADGGRRAADRRVEDRGDMGVPEVVDGSVVVEVVVAPITPVIAYAGITEAVVDAAVIADRRGPVAGVIDVIVVRVVPVPVTRRPQQIGSGRQRPVTGHPIIFSVIPRPIAGDPEESRAGNRRLRIDWNRRRGRRSGHQDVGLRMRRRDEGEAAARRCAQNERGGGGADEKMQWAKHGDIPRSGC